MKFTGVIKQITTYKHKGGVIFYVASKDAKCRRDEYGRVKCIASKRLLHQGLSACFEGEYDNGFINVNAVTPIFINEAFTCNYLINRLKGTHIKRSTISKIVDKYGEKVFSFTRDEFLNALNNDFDELGITIDKIISELYDPKPIDVLSEYLEPFGFEESVVKRIYETYGSMAINEFKQNPYNACFAMELSLAVADLIAYKEGIDAYDLRRIEGYIRHFIKKHEDRYGDTYVQGCDVLEDVLNEFERRHIVYGNAPVHAIDIANAILRSNLFVITDDGKLSSKHLYKAEETIARRIKMLMDDNEDPIDVSDTVIKRAEDKAGFTFGNSQIVAIKGVLTEKVSILTGGAGTGKTSIVRAIVDIYKEEYPHNNITFCAPTGRAAKRLSQSIRPYKASTIHHHLEIRPGIKADEITRNQNNPLEADFIIVEETSMVDVELMSWLLNAIKNDAKVLFIGDENQLPSVSPGNCLHDFIESGIIPVFRLTDIYRQSENSGIVLNSLNVLDGNEVSNEYDDFDIYEFDTNKDARKKLYELIDSLYDQKHPYDMQVIEPMNKDVSETNLYTHNKFVSEGKNISLGDKIMFKVNAQGLEYVNGEFGTISLYTRDDVVIQNEDNEQKIISADSVYENLKMAYSVTIHKMQGSEADTIIIHLPSNASNMMNKELLYTAITRAAKKCIIVSVDGAINDCVNKKARIRKTRLQNMLKA